MDTRFAYPAQEANNVLYTLTHPMNPIEVALGDQYSTLQYQLSNLMISLGGASMKFATPGEAALYLQLLIIQRLGSP